MMRRLSVIAFVAKAYADDKGKAINSPSTTRLTIVNGCETSSIWLAHMVAGSVGPDPQDVKIESGKSATFHTSAGGGGLAAVRYWAKMGCDETGGNCTIGDSGGAGESCVIRAPGKPDDYSQCAPPVDTKLEATFMAPGSPAMDTIDMSLVDGYSLPFNLEVSGGTCTREQKPFTGMDCSGLSLNSCPSAETLNGQKVSLQAVQPKTGTRSGCFSPCMKLTDDKWNSHPVAPDSPQAGPYCCAGAFASPGACSSGPVLQTKYLAAVKQSCPAAYGYAFDDKTATIVCATTTNYKLTFYCPSGKDNEQILV
eukprot:TRINITY_DN71470_c0_g1_i1.p1 TRINITY_DN71470_c0_g1~~TRINITY_DN71470_c0_g1_i1.p1  ORF type:complete len:310 (-),score=26.97 TRINITY_DN71470_c0_g1_i1:142-1071(-)